MERYSFWGSILGRAGGGAEKLVSPPGLYLDSEPQGSDPGSADP